VYKGHILSKLFKLKEWLTVRDAAKHLSVIFEEKVTEADIFRLALDGHLKLSVYFVNIKTARLGRVVTWEETDWFCASPLTKTNKTQTEISILGNVNPEKFKIYPTKLQELWNKYSDDERKRLTFFLKSTVIDDERFLNLDEKIVDIEDVWDLPLLGSERLDIKQRYHLLTTGNDITDVCLDGIFIEKPNSQTMCQLQDDETDFPSSTLPEDSVLVVRTAELREFEQKIADENDKDITSVKESTRKTENLLRTLAAAAIDGYGYRPEDKKSPTPQQISDALNQLGVELDPKTIRNYLKDGVNLLPRKD